MKLKKEILDKIEMLEHDKLNCNVFSVYDYSGHSIQELLSQFFTKINECIKVSNNSFTLADWLVSEGMEQECAKLLNVWLEDGTLEEVINESLLKNINDKLQKIETDLESTVKKSKIINGINSYNENEKISCDKYELEGAKTSNLFIGNDNLKIEKGKSKVNIGFSQHDYFEGEEVPIVEFTTEAFPNVKNSVTFSHVFGDNSGMLNDVDEFKMIHGNVVNDGNHSFTSSGSGKMVFETKQNTFKVDAKTIEIMSGNGGFVVSGRTIFDNDVEGINNIRAKQGEISGGLSVSDSIILDEFEHNSPYANSIITKKGLRFGDLTLIGASDTSFHLLGKGNVKADMYLGSLHAGNVNCRELGNPGMSIVMIGSIDGNGKNLGWSGSKFGMVSATNGWFSNINDKASLGISQKRLRAKGGTKIEDFFASNEENGLRNGYEKLSVNVSNVLNNSDANLFIDISGDETYIKTGSLIALMVEEIKELKKEINELKATI